MTPEQIAYGTKMVEAALCFCAIARVEEIGADHEEKWRGDCWIEEICAVEAVD